MTSKRYNFRAAVYLILIKDDSILLLRRFHTGWQDGKYSLIAGHLDGNETIINAMIREAKEESGIILNEEDLKVVHTMHRKTEEEVEYIDFFLTGSKWDGEPKIMETDKCDEMRWFPLTNLPDNLLPYVKQAVEDYKSDISFSEYSPSK